MFRALSLATLVVWTVAAVPCQDPTWELPPGGALLFDRTHAREFRLVTAPDKNVNIPGMPGPPLDGVVFDHELDRKKQRLARPLADLFELIPAIGLDLETLRRGGRIRTDLPPLEPFGLLELDGEAQKPGEPTGAGAGRQAIAVAVRTVDRNRANRKGLEGGEVNSNRLRIDAQLQIDRAFDPKDLRVTGFEATLLGSVVDTKGEGQPTYTIKVTEQWTLRDVSAPDTARFRERVNVALVAARDDMQARLRDHLGKLTQPDWTGNMHTDHNGGELALMVLTLLKAGVAKDDPDLAKGFDDLRRRDIRDTYSLGVTLMAFDALYSDPNERQNMLAGLIDRPQPRVVPEADLALMRGMVERLLENRDAHVDRAYVSRWHYLPGMQFDNSCTQYALLGLYAAQLCGIEVSPNVWWAAGRHFIESQCKLEDPIAVRLVSHRQYEKARADGRTSSGGTASKLRPAGWSYHGGGDAPYGSMTVGGVSSLTICMAALEQLDVRGGKDLGEMRAARQNGLAWMASHHEVRNNPGRGQANRLYFLYGLERACELSQVALLDDHDWYFEGATLILESQEDNGRFQPGSVVDNCFAILFLKKASLPVFTGGGR